MKSKLLIAGVLAAIAIPSAVLAQPYDPGCIRSNEDNRAAGTVVGGVAGALLGSAIAGRGSRGAGAVVGGVTGAVADGIAGANDHPCPAGYYYQGPPPREGDRDFWYGAPTGIHERIDFMQNRIETSASRGWISPRAADRMNDELNSIRDQDRDLRYRDGGHLSPADRDYLQSRLDDVSQRLHWADHRD